MQAQTIQDIAIEQEVIRMLELRHTVGRIAKRLNLDYELVDEIVKAHRRRESRRRMSSHVARRCMIQFQAFFRGLKRIRNGVDKGQQTEIDLGQKDAIAAGERFAEELSVHLAKKLDIE